MAQRHAKLCAWKIVFLSLHFLVLHIHVVIQYSHIIFYYFKLPFISHRLGVHLLSSQLKMDVGHLKHVLQTQNCAFLPQSCFQFPIQPGQRTFLQYIVGSMAEQFRALDLKSGGPWFKSSTLLLSGFVVSSPKFNSSTAFVNSQLVSLPLVGILNSLCSICNILLFIYSVLSSSSS